MHKIAVSHDCAHEHGKGVGGWIRQEASHMKSHWLSCVLGCVVVHLGIDLVQFLWRLACSI